MTLSKCSALRRNSLKFIFSLSVLPVNSINSSIKSIASSYSPLLLAISINNSNIIRLLDNIFTNVKVSSLFASPVDEYKWGAFLGVFKTNFVLPNYIGVGNGITRGFGTIYGMFNPDSFTFNENELKQEVSENAPEPIAEQDHDLESISASDVPKPRRRRKSASKGQKAAQQSTNRPKKQGRSGRPTKKGHKHGGQQKQRPQRTGRVFSEEFDIEDDSRNTGNQISEDSQDSRDDAKFNTEKHHKRQHKF